MQIQRLLMPAADGICPSLKKPHPRVGGLFLQGGDGAQASTIVPIRTTLPSETLFLYTIVKGSRKAGQC